MSRPIRKYISLSHLDFDESKKIIEDNEQVKTLSDVYRFLLYRYLKQKERDKEIDKILNKLSRMDYEIKLSQEYLREWNSFVTGDTGKESTKRFLKIENNLRKKLRKY